MYPSNIRLLLSLLPKLCLGFCVLLVLAMLEPVAGQSSSLPVMLRFDELPNNTVVADQYYNSYGVRFYSGSFFNPVHTYQQCGPCSTTSPPNFISTIPDYSGQVTVEFTQPVSNLTFYAIGVDAFFNAFAIVDVYRNGSPYATYQLYGNGTRTVGFTLGSLTNISKIIIRGITDPLGVGFDDFTFTIPADVKITNLWVNGSLNGTTQNALLGSDITLNASVTPGAFAGGAYSWTFTGPVSISGGGVSSPSVVIRSTGVGTITPRVNYTKNGVTVSASLTINAVLPSLTSFTAYQDPDRITPFATCDGGGPTLFTSYILGCPKFNRTQPGHVPGIRYTVNAQLPVGQYLNDTSQAGIKYVQIVSAMRKSLVYGSIVCVTARTQENEPDTGWQLDTTDPYNTGDQRSDPPQRFSGQSVTMIAEDPPKSSLQLYPDTYSEMDALLVNEPFETYVVYFVGSNASNPTFQRVLGFQNNSVAYIPWRWGGQIVFDPAAPLKFRLQSTTQPGPIQAQSKTQMRSYTGNVANIAPLLRQCPAGPARATNMIDVSKYFVRQHYLDFLNRAPDQDQSGWDFWRSQITQCAFDTNCITSRRYGVSRAFFDSGEFISNKPALAPSNKGTDSYNREFVRQCYYVYLRRTCDPQVCDAGGFNFWVNELNSDYQVRGDVAYYRIIEAFVTSGDYRNRFPPVPNF